MPLFQPQTELAGHQPHPTIMWLCHAPQKLVAPQSLIQLQSPDLPHQESSDRRLNVLHTSSTRSGIQTLCMCKAVSNSPAGRFSCVCEGYPTTPAYRECAHQGVWIQAQMPPEYRIPIAKMCWKHPHRTCMYICIMIVCIVQNDTNVCHVRHLSMTPCIGMRFLEKGDLELLTLQPGCSVMRGQEAPDRRGIAAQITYSFSIPFVLYNFRIDLRWNGAIDESCKGKAW